MKIDLRPGSLNWVKPPAGWRWESLLSGGLRVVPDPLWFWAEPCHRTRVPDVAVDWWIEHSGGRRR